MSKRNYYIFSSGKLVRKQNTLYFKPGEQEEPSEITSDEEEIEVGESDDSVQAVDEELEAKKLPAKPLPVEDIDSIYCFSELRFNTRFINFIAQKQILLHFFNYYGFYTGSFYPKETLVSGKLFLKQVDNYRIKEKRILLAREFILGSAKNILKTLQHHNAREKNLDEPINKIESLLVSLGQAQDIREMMGIEGNIRQTYYSYWKEIIPESFEFNKRVKRPPDNPINALISFGNSLVYTTVLSEIYKTQLNPTISFLHEPGEKRFSLSLDLAEIFKPLLCDRIIFALLNRNQLKEKHFTDGMEYCHLSEEGRKIFLKEFDDKLKTTIHHRDLKKSVSYRKLIRLECYKLVKHIIGEKTYKPFKIWW